MSHVISTRLQDLLYESLISIAKSRQRRLSEIVQEALNHYVENCADYQIALERLNNHLDEVIDGKELRRRLGWPKSNDV